MRKLVFLIMLYMMPAIAHAGPEDKWVYVGPANSFDSIALILAIAAFAWAYIIWRDRKMKKK